jgi:hypothetical protein
VVQRLAGRGAHDGAGENRAILAYVVPIMRATILLSGLFILLAAPSNAGIGEAIAAMDRGDYRAAYDEFLPLAEAGDDQSMISIGLLYHQGQGFKQDHAKAMDWYLKAFEKMNGDAYSNIGVMYRDGLSVAANKKIAYSLFLITHMRGLGTQATQERANSCLNRLVPTMTREELVEIFDYTEEYIQAFVKSRGTLVGVPQDCSASEKRPRLKDKDWWLPGELDFLEK